MDTQDELAKASIAIFKKYQLRKIALHTVPERDQVKNSGQQAPIIRIPIIEAATGEIIKKDSNTKLPKKSHYTAYFKRDSNMGLSKAFPFNFLTLRFPYPEAINDD